MKLTDFLNFATTFARPFTVYIVAVAFVIGMFHNLSFDVLGLAAGLLGWHGLLRTADKRFASGPAADGPDGAGS